MRIAVIGATGHVGGYLVPRLVRAGHDVVAISRGASSPYRADAAWDTVEKLAIDREREDGAGTFGETVAALDADVVIDMICFTPESAAQLVDALRGRVQHLVMCSSIWAKGTLTEVPATEDIDSAPWGDYGVGKAAIEALLEAEGRRADGLRSTSLRPGHISGPGWHVINPLGNLDPAVWEALAAGTPLTVPNFGLETVHHVHADDVAQAFELAVDRGVGATAERYNIVSERALTIRGFAESVARGFGREADLRFGTFDELRQTTTNELAETSLAHISRSQSMSIEKAKRDLGYAPKYSSLAAVAEAVNWLKRDGQLTLGGRELIISS
jgi:nucleoside-diphosphate-sugar epimerase